MKILLTAINAKYIHSNLAVYSLRANAKEYKDQVELAEYTINQYTEDILQDLYQKKPDILAFSCYIWNIRQVRELVREIRKVLPLVPVWLGGPESSYDAKGLMERYPEVTGVMIGEGEQTFYELCRYYDGKREGLSDLDGIAYREAGEIVVKPQKGVPDLNTLAFAYEDLNDFEHKIIYYESSRGCPFNCSYCLSSIDKKVRFRDPELVKKELKFFIDHKVPQVKFVDRTFNCKPSHAMEIWRFLTEHDNGVTNFHFEVAADLITEEELTLFQTMRKGLIQLEIGVQSTNENTIREIHRRMDFEKVCEVVNRIREPGNIHQHLDLIAGLPEENYESFAKSFDDVFALHPEQLQLGFLKVLKGSYMSEMTDSYGTVYRSEPPYEVLSTRWLEYEDVIRLKGIEQMVELYYNSHQYDRTLAEVFRRETSAFAFFEDLSQDYRGKGLHLLNHSRKEKYYILKDFLERRYPEEGELFWNILKQEFNQREVRKIRE
ncbi:MAG: DUF4080 domain-containing protein [Lachnospiraceae bacterium]